MTTPDTRTAADWSAESVAHRNISCDTLIDSRVVNPIDTSTTAGKIAVMQAYERGEAVISRYRKNSPDSWGVATTKDNEVHRYYWNWKDYDYRIAPPPAPRSALQNARSRMKSVLADEASAGDVQLEILVREIDSAPILHIHGSGSQANIDWIKTDSGPLTPGRYRLVRDDA